MCSLFHETSDAQQEPHFLKDGLGVAGPHAKRGHSRVFWKGDTEHLDHCNTAGGPVGVPEEEPGWGRPCLVRKRAIEDGRLLGQRLEFRVAPST